MFLKGQYCGRKRNVCHNMAEFCLHHQTIFEKSFSQSKRHYVLVFFHFILSNHYLFDKKYTFGMTTKLHKFDIIRFHSVNCEHQFDWNCLSAAYFALSKVNLVHPRRIIIFIFVIFLLITIGRACTETNFKLHIYSEKSTIYLSCSLITWKISNPSAGSTVKTNYTKKNPCIFL